MGVKIKIVSTVSDEQFKYVNDFIAALQEVDELYYTYTTASGEKKYPERVFAYELYHQFRKIMESKGSEFSGVYLNGEQTKNKKVVPILEQCAPDLILHKCVYEVQPNNQLWLCEIKMKGNQNATSDLDKFNKMAPLQFPCYVFLYAGVTYEEMRDEIKNLKRLTNTEFYLKTICISSYNYNGVKQIHCHSLKDIVENVIDSHANEPQL